MRIGVDVDGVLYDWHGTVKMLLKRYFHNDIGEWKTWDHLDATVPPEQQQWLWTEGVKRGLFLHGNVYYGSMEALRWLHDEGHDIVLVTARPRVARVDTINWIAHHRIPATEVHILSNRLKSSVTPYCDVFIDDSPNNIKDLVENTPSWVIMFEQPWNKDCRLANAGSDSWSVILREIERRNQNH